MKSALLKTWAGAAFCAVLLMTCGKKNDPLSNEPRITSFTVPNAQTIFRGDTIFVRLNSSFSETSIRPTITFEGNASIFPVSGTPQEFDGKEALAYALSVAEYEVKRYRVIVVPTGPVQLTWQDSQKAVNRCEPGGLVAPVRMTNVGTILSAASVRIRLADNTSSNDIMIDSYPLGGLISPARGVDLQTVPLPGNYQLTVEYRDAFQTLRRAQSINRLQVRDATRPRVNVLRVLAPGQTGSFPACGLDSTKTYEILLTDSLNRTYRSAVRYLTELSSATFLVPANVPLGAIQITLVFNGELIELGRTGVTSSLKKPYVERTIRRTHIATQSTVIEGATANQFTSGQEIGLVLGGIQQIPPGTSGERFSLKFSSNGREARRLPAAERLLLPGGHLAFLAKLPVDFKGTYQISLVIENTNGTTQETEPYWDKIRIE